MKKIINFFLFFIFLIFVGMAIIPMFLAENIEIKINKHFDNPVSEVFKEFNDLQHYTTWAMILSEDSLNTHFNYFSPYKGKNSSLTWENNKNEDIGKGEYRILESKTNQFIESQRIFDNSKVITLEKIFFKGDHKSSEVNISLNMNDLSYFNRIFVNFYTKTIEKKLNLSLDKLANKLKNDSVDLKLQKGNVEYANFPLTHIISVYNESTTQQKDIYSAVHNSLHDINKYLSDSLRYTPKDVKKTIIYYLKFDTANDLSKFYVGYSLNMEINPANLNEDLKLITLPAGKTIYTPINYKIKNILNVRYFLKKYATDNEFNIKPIYWEEYQEFPLSFEDEARGQAFYYIDE